MMRSTLVLVLVLLAAPQVASAGRVMVAIVPSTAANLEITRVDALSQDLADALRTELDIDTIAGLEVRRRLPDAGLPPDCVVNQACIADVARRLEAQQVLFVVMIDTGTSGAIQVDTTWVDAASQASAPRPAIQVPSVGDARSRFAAAARQLLPDAPVRAKAAASVGAMSPAVQRHFSLPSYLTAGATVAGVALGVSFGLRARSKYRDCEALVPRGDECSTAQRDSIRTTAIVADLGWVVALAGTVATTVLYATSGESSHVVVQPLPGGATVGAVGTF